MPSPTFEGVIMDTHHYQIFTDAEVGLSWEQHIAVRIHSIIRVFVDCASS